MQMLLPFSSVCPSFVTLRPVGVFSLRLRCEESDSFSCCLGERPHYSVTSSSTMSARRRRSQLDVFSGAASASAGTQAPP